MAGFSRASCAIRSCLVDTFTGFKAPPCFSGSVLLLWRLPSLLRVPASRVPRLLRYYEGATTSHRLLPACLWICSPGPRAASAVSLLPRGRRPPAGLAVVSPGQPSGLFRVAVDGTSQVPERSVRVTLPCSQTPAEVPGPCLTVRGLLPPCPTRRRPQHAT
jgi:hypothetical protein